MLGSDETHEMLTAYGVWAKKSMWGRKYMGILRNTYLIGPDGRIARIWEKVKVAGHAEEVLAAAKDALTANWPTPAMGPIRHAPLVYRNIAFSRFRFEEN